MLIVDSDAKTHMRDLIGTFNMFDTDGDGYITHEEVFNLLKMERDDITEQEVDALIAEMDR